MKPAKKKGRTAKAPEKKFDKRFIIWGVVCAVVFTALAVAVNVMIPARNPKQVFDSRELPSNLVGSEEEKKVTGGQPGTLTFGPYVTLQAGNYKVRVHYKTNTDFNTISSYSLSAGTFLDWTTLPANKSVYKFDLSLEEETPGVEVNVTYAGEGSLEVKYIEFIEQRQDLRTAQWVLNVLLVILFAALMVFDYFWEKIAWNKLVAHWVQNRKKKTIKSSVIQRKPEFDESEPAKTEEMTANPVDAADAERKQTVKVVALRMAAWAVVLAAFAGIVNYGIPALNKKQVFDSMDLPSSLVGEGEPRSIDNGGKRACLTFGPYITLASGEYTIRVYYDTDTDKNTVDVSSLDVEERLYLNTLLPEDKVHEFTLKLEETTTRVEVRTGYSGEGKLSVEKIEITPVREDLQAAQKSLQVLLIALFFGCCGYYLPKLKKNDAAERERIPWRVRLTRALPVALFISFTFFLAGPISLYIANSEEFWFSLWQMMPVLALAFAVLTITVTAVLSLVPGKGFRWISTIVFGLGAALYIEGNFLVQDYGLLNGNAIEWNSFSEWAAIDTLIWIAIPMGLLLLSCFSRRWIEKLVQYGSLFLVAVQAVALVIDVATAKDLDKSSEYLLTTKNYTVVSEDENIIVFLLDAFDAKYMDDLLTNYPEYKETFADFVWYKDTAAAAAPTHVAIPVILTGYRYTDPISYKEYVKKAFDYTPLYSQLAEHDYDTGVYSVSRYVSGEQGKYISNIYNESPIINSQSHFFTNIVKLTSFRYMPHIFKNWFTIYSGEFEELKSANEPGESSYSMNSSESYTMLQQPLTFESGSNAFRFYHLSGAHGPWCLNENAEVVANEDTTREKQMRGCFLIIDNYLNQLREKGVYDNSTIIIMADHGNVDRQQNPLLMIKAENSRGDFGISTAQISYMDLLPTLLNILGEDGSEYGRNIFEIGETEKRERFFYRDFGTGARELVEQMTTDVAWNYDAWMETGKIYYGDANPENRQKYVFGTELSFLEEASGNRYAVEGLGRISDYYTITVGDHSILDIPLAHKPKADIQVRMSVRSVIGAENQLIVYANDAEVFNDENANGTIEFTIPKDLVDDNITLRLEYPDAVDIGYLSAFNLVDLKMSEQAP